MRTTADIIALWPSVAAFARDIGIKPAHAQTIKARGSLPSAYWAAARAAAARRGIEGITIDALASLAAARLNGTGAASSSRLQNK